MEALNTILGNMISKTRVSMTREFATIRTVNEYDDNDISLSAMHVHTG